MKYGGLGAREYGNWLVGKCHITCRVYEHRYEKVLLYMKRRLLNDVKARNATGYVTKRSAASAQMTETNCGLQKSMAVSYRKCGRERKCKWKVRFAAAANLTFRFDIE